MIQTIHSKYPKPAMNEYVVPMAFGTEDWDRYLPIESYVYLMMLCSAAARRLSKTEAIAEIEALVATKKEPAYHDFDADPPESGIQREIFLEEREGATEQRAILEMNGYFFPQSIPDIFELFKRFDMIHEIAGDTGTFDVILHPFPKPAAYFKTKRGASK